MVILMKNRFNDLTGKEWLPFQKSFMHFEDFGKLYEKNIHFFTKPSTEPTPNAFFLGSGSKTLLFQNLCDKAKIGFNKIETDFILFDLLDELDQLTSKQQIDSWIDYSVKEIISFSPYLNHRKFISVLIQNVMIDNQYIPLAWEISNRLSHHFTRKDEKIICKKDSVEPIIQLFFRKDEDSELLEVNSPSGLWKSLDHSTHKVESFSFPSWFVLKPKPRNKKEILHPAKYPENLVSLYLNQFTKSGDAVFDPMSGTGTTQVEALKLGRNAYGVELSPLFFKIAVNRCKNVNSSQDRWHLLHGDARDWEKGEFPLFDYVITSPPYWDMLNMQGAENQALRKKKGLKTNYSSHTKDIGNINSYKDFLSDLIDIYQSVADNIKKDGYMTIIVKNVKKKGEIYPLAFDLVERLNSFIQIQHVSYWCQDDQRLAPYGFGNTWVSNTFHHYCLTFRKTN